MNKESEEKKSAAKEEEVKEKNTLTLSSGVAPAYASRTRGELAAIAKSIPTLEMVKSHAHDILAFYDDRYIEEWYREMCASFWCDEFGNPIKNWGWMFTKWKNNRKLFEKIRDPERIPDARKGAKKTARKADNWRGTKSGEVGDALG